MRKSFFTFHFSLFILALAGCSHIDEDERLIYVPPVDATRAVLIEDFTGQRCANCPNAAAEIARLQEQYGHETVVAVAVHGGPLAFAGNARNIGLSTPLGDEYVEHWGVANTLPKGYVNRRGTPSNPEQWGTLVREATALPAVVELETTATVEAGKVSIAVRALGLETVSGKLQVWLTESGITAMQSMPDGSTNREYVHNHVLRAAVNGAWGTDIALRQGEYSTQEFEYTLAGDWNADRMAVVAFVYDDSGVLQVVETKLSDD